MPGSIIERITHALSSSAKLTHVETRKATKRA